MQEYFEQRTLKGTINVACKFEGQPTRYWTTDKELVIRQIVSIVNKYAGLGEQLTLRQLHYQFVGHVPGYVNHDTAYKKLGTILDDCRYCGLIPWNAFEDRGRRPFIPYSVKDIPDALQDTVDQYRINRQEGQNVHVELWTEKDALSAFLRKSTTKYHIHLVVNKGYTSSTAAYEAYRRILKPIREKKKVVILYFGDHDPSGLDMVRDIRERLLFFLCRGSELNRSSEVLDWWEKGNYNIWDAIDFSGIETMNRLITEDDPRDKDVEDFEAVRVSMYLKEKELFEVRHIGLTIEQVREFNLPENPTKMTDTRANEYIRRFGRRCWEVDALELTELRRIVEANIQATIDIKQFNKVVAREKKEIKTLTELIEKLK